jgi:hypothetical protein
MSNQRALGSGNETGDGRDAPDPTARSLVEGHIMSTLHPHSIIHRQALDFWLARGAVLMIVVLQLLVVNDLSFGPRWLAPTIELAMLVPLSVGTAWTRRALRHADPATNVADITRRYGFTELGRFAVMYRRYCSEKGRRPPSRTPSRRL